MSQCFSFHGPVGICTKIDHKMIKITELTNFNSVHSSYMCILLLIRNSTSGVDASDTVSKAS